MITQKTSDEALAIVDTRRDTIVKELHERHGCHTAILYGSQARGDANEVSDYDIIGIRQSGNPFRDARLWDGLYLDIFIYPESTLAEPTEQFLYLREGKILFQKDDFGTRLLSRLEAIYRAGPKKLRKDEIEALRVWHQKALARIRLGGIQGNLRRAELLPALLEHLFTTRGEWYCGFKAAFQWLNENRPEVYAAFDAALQPSAPLASIERLVTLVDDLICNESKPAELHRT